jgi:hypothetical protein
MMQSGAATGRDCTEPIVEKSLPVAHRAPPAPALRSARATPTHAHRRQDVTDTLPVIRKTFRVSLDPGPAFKLFTEGLADWWPLDSHSLSARDGRLPESVLVEPREGGHIVERRHDGETAPWAEITGWSPGRRLSLAWHVGRSRDQATQVDIRFKPTMAGTLVALEHAGFEALGPKGETVASDYDAGWDKIIGEHFHRACAG